jgi:hypothetical protein
VLLAPLVEPLVETPLEPPDDPQAARPIAIPTATSNLDSDHFVISAVIGTPARITRP